MLIATDSRVVCRARLRRDGSGWGTKTTGEQDLERRLWNAKQKMLMLRQSEPWH